MSTSEMSRVARTLSEIAHGLASADDPLGRMRHVLSLIAKLVPYDRCALLDRLPAPQGTLVAVPEPSADERREIARRVLGYLRILVEDADLAADGPTTEGPEPASVAGGGRPDETGSYHLAIPVAGLSEVVGVLFLERSGPAYDEDSLRLLSIVAAQLGAYLTTLQMREQEIERARHLAAALHRLQDMDRRKDEFLSMLGHELRNPLGAIYTALRVIDVRVADADPNARYHRVIDRQLATLSRLVDDLLDASRVRLGKIVLKRERVDLCSVARRWMEAFGGDGHVQAHDVTLTLPDDPINVDGDPVRLEQVLSNLLANALKFTPTGGEIRVAVGSEGGEGVVRVRDNGIGMTPELLARAFDLFSQANVPTDRSGGIGLGLSLVRSLVEKHGGTVEGRSEGPGRGSEFVVRLPLASGRADAPGEEAPPMSAMTSAAALRILIVEDSDDARAMLEEWLGSWGHHVFSSSDGLQGVAKALAERPDVVLCDIAMPGLDGFDVARRIRQELSPKEMALFAMTGFGQPEDRRRALDAGFDAYMVKPIDPSTLRKQLTNVTPADPSAPIRSPRRS